MSARRLQTPAAATPEASAKIVNISCGAAFQRSIAHATPTALKRLRRSATTLTDAAELHAAVVAATRPEEVWTPQPDALPTPAEMDRRIAARHAARAVREQALDTIDTLARLPDLHAAALLRSAGLPSETPALLRERLATEPVRLHLWTAPGAPLTLEEQIEEAGQRLIAIAPPPTECSPVGAALVRGDEEEIKATAEEMAQAWIETYAAAPTLHTDDPATRAEHICPRWWRRKLRKEALRAQAYYDTALRMARPGSEYVSGYTLGAWRQRQQRNAEWAAGMDVTWDDGITVPLSTIQKNSKKSKRAQLYAMVKAMEWTAEHLGYTALFLTFTLPGEWHSYIVGKADDKGGYPHARENPAWTPEHGPRSQIDELNHRWGLFRARLAKRPELRQYFGVLVPEPHQDGTIHMHAMVWLPTRHTHNDRDELTLRYVRRVLKDIAPDRQSKIVVVRKKESNTKKAASPATYVMKYVLKSLGTEGVDVNGDAPDGEEHMVGEAAERYRSWAAARGLRRMRLIGVHGGIRVWQRLWTAADDEALPERHGRARAALRAAQAAGEHARHCADPAERARLQEQQAAAFAQALGEIGALPHLGDGGSLRLRYNEGVTEYGRPTRRAVAVVDDGTGEELPLRRRTAALVAREKTTEATAVTVVAICPSGAAGAAPADGSGPDEADLAAADMLETLIAGRNAAPAWQEWCERMRDRVIFLRTEGTITSTDGLPLAA